MPETEFSEEEASTETSSIADDSDESETVVSATDSSEPPTPRARKTVRFADDCGKPLAMTKIMTEPSDYPPTIDPAVSSESLFFEVFVEILAFNEFSFVT